MRSRPRSAGVATSAADARNTLVDPEVFDVAAILCATASWLRLEDPAQAERLVDQAAALLTDRGRYAVTISLELAQ